jgi:hypothetical protein
MELDVGAAGDGTGHRTHEVGDVRRREVPLERLLALPLLDEHELVLVLGVLVEPVAEAAVLLARRLCERLADPLQLLASPCVGHDSSHDNDHLKAPVLSTHGPRRRAPTGATPSQRRRSGGAARTSRFQEILMNL